MGVVSPISGLSALIPVGYAFFVKGDRLSLILSIGAALAIVGAFLASGPEISQGLPLKPLFLARHLAPLQHKTLLFQILHQLVLSNLFRYVSEMPSTSVA